MIDHVAGIPQYIKNLLRPGARDDAGRGRTTSPAAGSPSRGAMSALVPPTDPAPVISVVVPLFNEQENVAELHRRLDAVLQSLDLILRDPPGG